jgi:hypothetical membrane protein
VLAGFVIAAASLTAGHDHVVDHISALGAQGSPHAVVMNAGFVVHALLVTAFAYGLYRRLATGRGPGAVFLLLVASGFGTLLSAVFRADPTAPDTATTFEGTVHAVFAQEAFFAFLVAILVFAGVIRRDRAWRGFAWLSLAVMVLNLALFIPFLTGAASSIEGALQRSLLVLSFAWLVAVSIRALGIRTPSAASDVYGEAL